MFKFKKLSVIYIAFNAFVVFLLIYFSFFLLNYWDKFKFYHYGSIVDLEPFKVCTLFLTIIISLLLLQFFPRNYKSNFFLLFENCLYLLFCGFAFGAITLFLEFNSIYLLLISISLYIAKLRIFRLDLNKNKTLSSVLDKRNNYLNRINQSINQVIMLSMQSFFEKKMGPIFKELDEIISGYIPSRFLILCLPYFNHFIFIFSGLILYFSSNQEKGTGQLTAFLILVLSLSYLFNKINIGIKHEFSDREILPIEKEIKFDDKGLSITDAFYYLVKKYKNITIFPLLFMFTQVFFCGIILWVLKNQEAAISIEKLFFLFSICGSLIFLTFLFMKKNVSLIYINLMHEEKNKDIFESENDTNIPIKPFLIVKNFIEDSFWFVNYFGLFIASVVSFILFNYSNFNLVFFVFFLGSIIFSLKKSQISDRIDLFFQPLLGTGNTRISKNIFLMNLIFLISSIIFIILLAFKESEEPVHNFFIELTFFLLMTYNFILMNTKLTSFFTSYTNLKNKDHSKKDFSDFENLDSIKKYPASIYWPSQGKSNLLRFLYIKVKKKLIFIHYA